MTHLICLASQAAQELARKRKKVKTSKKPKLNVSLSSQVRLNSSGGAQHRTPPYTLGQLFHVCSWFLHFSFHTSKP